MFTVRTIKLPPSEKIEERITLSRKLKITTIKKIYSKCHAVFDFLKKILRKILTNKIGYSYSVFLRMSVFIY